jgi:hypothetical protein
MMARECVCPKWVEESTQACAEAMLSVKTRIVSTLSSWTAYEMLRQIAKSSTSGAVVLLAGYLTLITSMLFLLINAAEAACRFPCLVMDASVKMYT